jgi:hypothetical protein
MASRFLENVCCLTVFQTSSLVLKIFAHNKVVKVNIPRHRVTRNKQTLTVQGMCFVPCSITYLFHVAESFVRNWYVLSYSRNYHHFMEPGGSSPYTQQPATCPCSEPDRPGPCPIISLFYDPFYCYPPIYVLVFQVVSFPQVSPPTPDMHLSSPIHATCLAHLSLLGLTTWIVFIVVCSA